MSGPAERSRWSGYSSVLAKWILAFLDAKAALGRKYTGDHFNLRLLDRFLVEQRVTSVRRITPEVIDAFLASRHRTGPKSFNSLLGIVRRFFAWVVTQGLLSATPVRTRSRREVQGRLPYIFDVGQVRQVLDSARRLPDSSRSRVRGETFRTIFALLYGLGLRVSEAANLLVSEIDFNRNVLTVRAAKFGKTRLVPFGPKMASMLREYVGARHGSVAAVSRHACLFSFSHSGKPVSTNTIRNIFQRLLLPLKIRCPEGTTRPRVHDLRHSFAVGTLLRWYRSGIRPGDRLEHLSIFLGHRRAEYTSVYLTITAELLVEAGGRFERFAGPLLRPRDEA